MKRAAVLLLAIVALAYPDPVTSAPRTSQSRPTRVGVVLDGASPSNDSIRVAFEREILEYFGRDRAVEFPERHRLDGSWTRAGATAAIDRLLADRDVDIVLALGPVTSDELARRRSLPKPAIAALVVDVGLQGLPVREGASGVPNLSYVDVALTTARTMQLFHDLVPYRSMAVMIRGGIMEDVPGLAGRAHAIAETLGVAVSIVPVGSSAAQALASIPAGTDAVYLGSMEELTEAGIDSVLAGLTARKLPTFSTRGPSEVERGALACFAPSDDVVRRARRVAGNLQRIRNGEDAGTLPVQLSSVSQLTLNMETARAIGFSPQWETLLEANLIHAEAPSNGPTWSLAGVAREAVRVNLDLQAAEQSVVSGRKNVDVARGALFPQVRAAATGTVIKEETAASSFGVQAERETQGQLEFSMPLLDDRTWADLSVERHRQDGREADLKTSELDLVEQATVAYLDVLRAKAIARVERENERTSRSNLELAQLRETTGASSRADVYRWQAEVARGRIRVLTADTRVQVAGLALNQVLNRPLGETFQTVEASADDPVLVASDPRVRAYFSNPERFRVFGDFLVTEGVGRSSELATVDAALGAQGRVSSAASRSFWLPTLSLNGALRNTFSREGEGSSFSGVSGIPAIPRGPDETWSVRMEATLPIFDGFSRSATLAQSNSEVERLRTERKSAETSVSSRILGSLHRARGTWLGIEQARVAASASRSNLDLVADSYSRGATSIVTLLDAQQASLSAEEAAASAVYDFLADLMAVQRAVGRFDFFATREDRESFLDRMDAHFRKAGVAPDRR